MHSKNAFAAAKEAALAQIAAAQQFDVELAAAVSSAVSPDQLQALASLTNRRHWQHARVAETCRYLTKLGTRRTSDPLRTAIQRGDAKYIAGLFCQCPADADWYVLIDVEGLDEARGVFDAVLAAAWPCILDECHLPAGTAAPAGVFDAYITRRGVHNGKVTFSLGPQLARALPPGYVCEANRLKLCRVE